MQLKYYGARPSWRLALPMLLAAVGVFLLVGCIYLPIPEHGADWFKKDFRTFIDPKNGSSPIHVGRITRDQLVKTLGRPTRERPDERRVFYEYTTERDFVLYPICFIAQPGDRTSHAVAFQFDAQGLLSGWETADIDAHFLGGGAIQSPYLSKPNAANELDRSPTAKKDDTQPSEH